MGESLETYTKRVEVLESSLASYAKRSFESQSQCFVDGAEILKYFSERYKKDRAGLENRTPLQLERDRILYSRQMRKQTEKYHVLYNGRYRIVRNYTTDTMRMAQVTRSICGGLRLNADFAEAIAMGSKVGAVPFVHAAKSELSNWASEMIGEIDKKLLAENPKSRIERAQGQTDPQLSMDFEAKGIPGWISQLNSGATVAMVEKCIPWAAGTSPSHLYSSGQESYWLLCTNPFTVQALPRRYSPETMFGIWRHTRGLRPGKDSFQHKMKILAATSGYHEIRWDACTFEALVVQFADDITWIIENLNDAEAAALLNGQKSLYMRLMDHLRADREHLPDSLRIALSESDAGALYNHFINDFVNHSKPILSRLEADASGRQPLVACGAAVAVGLSPDGEHFLDQMSVFLTDCVFNEPRVSNRRTTLAVIARACVDLLYKGGKEALPRLITERSLLERWPDAQTAAAMNALDDPIHRVQLSMDAFAEMGDQEIYDFVGIESL